MFIKNKLSLVSHFKSGVLILLCIFLCQKKSSAQTVLIDPNGAGGFEIPSAISPFYPDFISNSWNTTANPGSGARWHHSDPGDLGPTCFGDGAAYVSKSSSTTESPSYIAGTAAVAHIYKEVTFPIGEEEIVLTFSYKGLGDGTTGNDGVKVYFTTSTPIAGVALPSLDRVGNPIYNNKNTCSTAQVLLPTNFAGTTKKLVFSWVNDNLGTAALSPLSIDDVSLTSKILVAPGCASLLAPLNGATGVCVNAAILKWLAPTALGIPTGYKLSLGTNVTADNLLLNSPLGNVFSFNPGALLPNTTYYWKITPGNSIGDAIGCPIWSFTTGGAFVNPAIANTPVYTDFEDCSIWTLVNGTQTNKWEIGSATKNGGSNSIYISDDNGASNQYSSLNNGDNSTVHFFKDIAFPSGQTCIQLTFDLRTVGDPGLDFLRVMCDETAPLYTPVAGNLQNPPAQGLALLGEYSLINDYTPITITLPASYAGQTRRIIFSWRNNGTNFLQTPAAIDNINIFTAVQPAPDCVNIVYPQDGFSDLCEVGQVLNWQPNISGCNAPTGYNIYFGTNPIPPFLSAQTGTTKPTGLLLQGTTYYWRIEPTIGPLINSSCPVNSFTTSATGIVNDLPCNAVNVTLGATIDGYNGCTNSLSEPTAPASPANWTSGTLNTVWYKVVCPASGQLKIRTIPGTLTATQIAIYQGACTSLTPLAGTWYNTDGPLCGNAFIPVKYSQLIMTGLTPGSTYYVVVDGQNNLIGDFSILIVDGSLSYPGVVGQDCITTISPCSSLTKVIDPGFLNFGLTCDIPNSTYFNGIIPLEENNSVWYKLVTNGAGPLSFNIVPNDYGNPNPFTLLPNPGYSVAGNEANYSFALWKMDGLVTCSTILAGTSNPIKINTNAFGVTGCTTSGNAPVAYGTSFDGAYEVSQNTGVLPETYYLLVTDNTTDKVGYTIDFGTSPINYLLLPTEVYWTGGSNFNWDLTNNWGGCTKPDCPIDATITTASVNQPILTNTLVPYKVKNLTIDAGATLTLNPGVTLEVCGSITNNGTITTNLNSTIKFTGTGNQFVGGDLSLLSKLYNLEITKPSGTVFLNSNVEIAGNFRTSNSTSILNTNGNSIKLAGNFYNYNGNSTFIDPVGTTILEFSGATAIQNFQEILSSTDFNNVEINKTAGIVNLLSNLKLKNTGILTLTNGIFTTNTFEINVQNTLPASVLGGSATSYVNGNLRRSLSSLGSYNFPVGIISKGYQLANIDFTAATSIPNLLARFDTWVGAPPIQGGVECLSSFVLPAEDNGYWTISASANGTSGTYNTNLYPGGATNTALALGWSIIKSSTIAGPWVFDGTCVFGATSTNVKRTGMNGFSVFAIGQATTPLPIELLSFTGKNYGEYNILKWQTATEINNDYFELERSTDGNVFESITVINGQGNSTVLVNYDYKDDNFLNTLNYYRLKQTDYNDDFAYSDVIVIDNGKNDLPEFAIIPNPFKNEFEVNLNKLNKGDYFVEIYNLMGQLVKKQKASCNSNNCSTTVNTDDLKAGSYCVKVLSQSNSYVTSKIAIKE